MFVSVIVEPSGLESGKAIVNILSQSGFKKIQKSCWENMRISEDELAQLKLNIDRVTDYYDTVRFYQFPVENSFVVTELKQKKWRKCALKASENRSESNSNKSKITKNSTKTNPL